MTGRVNTDRLHISVEQVTVINFAVLDLGAVVVGLSNDRTALDTRTTQTD